MFGLVDSITISGPSIRFLIDNANMVAANWSCESSCFHNNPQPDLNEGLGTLEIKPESLRFVVCATSDLLVDASFNVETWLLDKVSRGFRATIIAASLQGDGVGSSLRSLRGTRPLSPSTGALTAKRVRWTPPRKASHRLRAIELLDGSAGRDLLGS